MCRFAISLRIKENWSRPTLCFVLLLLMSSHIITLPVACGQTFARHNEKIAIKMKIRTEGRERLSFLRPTDLMPDEIDTFLETHIGTIHLRLKQHHNAAHKTGAPAGTHCPACDIPVYTRRYENDKGGQKLSIPEILEDDFPRLYANHSKVYRDGTHQASFLVIQDPRCGSFKLFGSFRAGIEQYFIQPFTMEAMNTTTENFGEDANSNTHVLEKAPMLEYSADHSGLFLMMINPENPFTPAESSDEIHLDPTDTDIIFNRSSAPLPMTTSMRNNKTEFPAFLGKEIVAILDISLTTTGDTTDSVETNMNDKNNTDYFEFNSTQKGSTINQEIKADITDLAKLVGRQRKYWYHGDLEHFVFPLPTMQTTMITTETPVDELVVEIFFVCDFLCYEKFQDQYRLSDPAVTKNVIAQYFAYVRDFHETAYGSLQNDYPELELAVEIRVVGLYIATNPSDKIIGDYIIGDNKEIDSVPSLFEFILWVEDTLSPHLKADHYVLVTGYDLSGESNFILGLVSNIPSVCQLDSVSLTELWLPFTASIMAHELGHSLGADHDGLTNGFCQDDQQFIMAAVVGGAVPEQNVGNSFRFSNCSAVFFKAALPERECLRREDFKGSPLPSVAPPVGQSVTLDEQCAALVNNSIACRENITTDISGSWDGICSNNLCRIPETRDDCFEMTPLQFTSCGNKRWCKDGVCVHAADAPEKPIDCPAGDASDISCNAKLCRTGGYDDLTRFIKCCHTCQPVKTERFVIVSGHW